MVWCCQATSHYPNWWWSRSMIWATWPQRIIAVQNLINTYEGTKLDKSFILVYWFKTCFIDMKADTIWGTENTWKQFLCHWSLCEGIHWRCGFSSQIASNVELWCLLFLLAWARYWINSQVADDLKPSYDVTGITNTVPYQWFHVMSMEWHILFSISDFMWCQWNGIYCSVLVISCDVTGMSYIQYKRFHVMSLGWPILFSISDLMLCH